MLDAGPTEYERFRCEVEPHRESVRIRPIGELDVATVPVVEAHLSELAAVGFKELTLDLRAVRFLDSTALRLIIVWDAKSRADGINLSLIPGPAAVQRLFDLTGTTARLSFVPA